MPCFCIVIMVTISCVRHIPKLLSMHNFQRTGINNLLKLTGPVYHKLRI